VAKRLGILRRPHDNPLREIPSARHTDERFEALRVRGVDEGTALEDEAVEEVQRERHPPERLLHVVHATEATHELLKR